MYKVLVFLGAISLALAATQTQEFAAQLTAAHDESAHSDRMLLCSELPGDRTLAVTFFNLTNVDQFLNGQSASLKEVGPIVYKELRARANCSMNFADMAINFGQSRSYHGLSGNPDVKVNVPNVPFMRLGEVCESLGEGASTCISELVAAGEGYVNVDRTIHDILYQGVDVSSYKNVIAKTPALKGEVPELQQNSFSILKELSYPKKYTLNSESDSYGNIMLMDEQAELTHWETTLPICRQFSGTTGDMFPGKISDKSVLNYYSEDTCGAAFLVYDSKDTSYGFPALKFVYHTGMLDSNVCYTVDGVALKQGAINVKTCQRGLPYIVSYPHFYESDSSYKSGLVGMTPVTDKHQSYFIIEPTTGMIIESSQKFQVNVNMKKLTDGPNAAMKDSIVPLFWYDKTYKLDSTHIEAIKSMINNPSVPTTTTTAKPVVPGTGTGENYEVEFEEVQHKLKEIWTQIHVMSVVVFTFIVLAVLVLVGFSIVQFRANSKRNNAPIPPAYAQYETKP